jgi:hypothetical protein
VDVRLTDGQLRLFWSRDLEEISFRRASWRFLLGGVQVINSANFAFTEF